MSEILSAASIFLAVLGLLYSSWYPEIKAAINEKIPHFKEDRKAVKQKVNEAYHFRIFPIALAALFLALILLPDFIKLVSSSCFEYSRSGIIALRHFHAGKTLFCAIFFMAGGLAIHTIKLTLKLRRQYHKIINE